ncbi:HET domain-containing protein [Fusarium sp. Ph1]|nr:HET domain-containing protein [Fusarium sp. Ph1]
MAPQLPKCDVCLDLDKELLERKLHGEAYSCYLEEIIASSEKCQTCCLLLKAVRHSFPEVFAKPAFFQLYFSHFGGEGYQRSNDVFGLSVSPKEFPDTEDDPLEMIPGGWKPRVLHIFSMQDKPNPWPLFGGGSVISSDRQALAAQAKGWIHDCETNHPDCRRAQTSLPKRVVQMIPGPGSGVCTVRLYEPPQDTQGVYACLSHCWGKHQIITTTRSNFNQHQDEIPWDDLSTTFQDAIEFCLRLGLEFIWIDSLCIVQDDADEWEQEAVKMATYYTNAHVTLAATAAPDGTVGLFPEPHAEDQPLLLEGTNKRGEQYHLVARTSINHVFEDEQDALTEFPLMTRGWVYQEHILSRRFLHFGRRELMWECHSATRCQCGVIPKQPRSDYTTNQVLSVAKTGVDVTNKKSRRRMWYDNVEAIMNLNFTYFKDRLPAAAGVAKRLAKEATGRYLAGLWEDCLIADLCWSILENGERSDELKGFPSWSWGSVSGGLATLWCQSDLDDDNVKPVATVLEISCEPDPPSFLGHVDRAILVIESRVATATMSSVDMKGRRVRELQFKNAKLYGELGGSWTFHPDVQNWEMDDAEVEVVIVEMMRETVDEKVKSATFLVLQPDKDLSRRVGLLRAQVRRRRGAPDQGLTFLDHFLSEATTATVNIC